MPGISFEMDSFYSDATFDILYKKGNRGRKVFLIAAAYLCRLFRLRSYRHFDYIFIQRAASPVGPAFFETILARLFKKKIIYDFDDAIWMPQDGKGGRFFRWLKSYDKVGSICRMAYCVTPGNEFLADYARRFTNQVKVIPTVVDTEKKYTIQKKHSAEQELVVGWTGSHSTLRYLLSLKETLIECDRDPETHFLIIADKPPTELHLTKLRFIPWKEESEISDLVNMDVGIMPLIDNDWTRGKCGFKAIQYMALGIPALVSPVGVNETIVDDGINGFVCRSSEDWTNKIQLLKNDPGLRQQMGEAAREKIKKSYSINYAFPLILAILNNKP